MARLPLLCCVFAAILSLGGPSLFAQPPGWSGSGSRNHVASAGRLVEDWAPGEFDRRTGKWDPATSRNIRWVAKLGTHSGGSPVVADGRLFVGTNNGAGYLPRYPATVDLGCLLCFRAEDGEFLWQFSAEKLPTGRVHDWPTYGILSPPWIEGDRGWFVSNRGEVVCFDTQGFHDGEDDGPELTPALATDQREADVLWRFDMMGKLGSRQHNLSNCCICAWKETIFVCTGNGVDESHINIPAPDAPSFIALDKRTGAVRWTSNLPGKNIHHGQWCSPSVGMLGGVPQVIFGGGDGWVYSFHAEEWKDGRPRLLWKFDTNDKDAELILGGSGQRCEPIGPPVLFDGRVYLTTGQDPEHGEGPGSIWCIDPTRQLDGSDISPTRVVDAQGREAPHRREGMPLWDRYRLYVADLDADLDQGRVTEKLRKELNERKELRPGDAEAKIKVLTKGSEWELSWGAGEQRVAVTIRKHPADAARDIRQPYYIASKPTGLKIVANPKSGVVWRYTGIDRNGDGELAFYEQMHRTLTSVAIEGDLLFCTDFSGLLHCLDRRTGRPHWASDQLAGVWTTPLIADGRVFVADEDGDVAIYKLSADPAQAGTRRAEKRDRESVEFMPATEMNMNGPIYSTPTAAEGVLYLATRNHLFAIGPPKKP